MTPGDRETDVLLPSLNSSSTDERGNSCCRWTARLLGLVDVEPAVLLCTFGFGLLSTLIENLWIEKTCLMHFGFSEDVCDDLNSGQHQREQDVVHRLVSRYRVYAKVIEHVPGLVAMVVLGGCSDARDRRLPLLWCQAGFLLMALTSLANVYWWWLPPEFLLINYVPYGIAGGISVLTMSVTTYVSAASSGRARTTRFSVLKVMATVGLSSGTAASLLLFKRGGYFLVFGTQALAFLVANVYAWLQLERRPGDPDTEAPVAAPGGQQGVLSFSSVRRTLQVVTRERTNGGRRRLLAHILIVWLLLFCNGSFSFLFLSARKRFHWDYKAFTLWSLVDTSVSALGPLLLVPTLGYWWGAEDALLGLLGSFSLMLKHVLAATAPRAWVLYLAAAAGAGLEMVGASSRASVSKVVGREEVGAVFAVVSVGEALTPILSSAVLAALYSTTLNTFPGAVFALTAAFSTVLSCVFTWLLTSPGANPQRGEAVADSRPSTPPHHALSGVKQ